MYYIFRVSMEDALTVETGFGEVGNLGASPDSFNNSLTRRIANAKGGFFGVYDGHGGREAADFVQGKLHHVLEKELKNDKKSNSPTSKERGSSPCVATADSGQDQGRLRVRAERGQKPGNAGERRHEHKLSYTMK